MRLPSLVALGFMAGALAASEPAPDSALQALQAAESDAAAVIRRSMDALDPSLHGWVAQLMVAWIAESRDAAVQRGVEPIPPAVREALSAYVPAEILDRVRWRVDDSTLSVQQTMFQMGYMLAVTMDQVVVFAQTDDVDNPALWAHELFHVMQYQEWGIEGFVARYLADYESVERDAWDFSWRWLELTGRVSPR
jgi:hypothetical protein